jgi:hypothetical protein
MKKNLGISPLPTINKIKTTNMFKILAKINQLILPSLTKRRLDVTKAKNWQKALIAYRYYVTVRALD